MLSESLLYFFTNWDARSRPCSCDDMIVLFVHYDRMTDVNSLMLDVVVQSLVCFLSYELKLSCSRNHNLVTRDFLCYFLIVFFFPYSALSSHICGIIFLNKTFHRKILCDVSHSA